RNSVIQGREALGGLVGYNHGTIVNCSSRAEVIGGNDEAVGGLAGLNDGQISNCYSCGSVSGVLCVGGLVGYAFKNSSISNCYSQADTIVDYNYAAGLVVNNGGAIYKCYATGKVEGSTGGGLVFRNDGIVLGCFWDVETTGQDSSNGGIGLPTEFMQDPNTFTTAGWDFVGDDQGSEDNWQMCIDGVDYPRLAWQFIRPGDFIFPGRVDNYDLFVLANDWLSESSRCCDIAPPASPDGIVNLLDWSEFSRHWLTE
ncbi:MAG: hypothetical protein JW810_14070, partial [Sedimentisphaerales bacterium]|nr:hypothetical protein [Sedimentisphaerales bacterium]